MNHLLNILGTDYKYTVDWAGCNFCGLKFEWNYKDGYVDISIPGYIKDSLCKLKHVPSKQNQHPPHEYFPVDYSRHDTTQYATTPNKSPTLAPKEIKCIQLVVGTFLYYARTLDVTMLPYLNDISSQ